jgi:hypothetical protein
MEFFVYFTKKEGEQMTPPSPEGMAEMGKLMQEGMQSGLIVSTGQLDSTTTHLRLAHGEISVTDGPFMEGKELIPGFTIIKVDSKQEAIDWVAKLRRSMGDGELRMAQIFRPGME